MTNRELSNYINHYIEKDQTKSAIMLTGDWGTGKSHYIKNELIPFLMNSGGHKCILVSLYGISHVNDISKSIYLEARARILNTKSEGIATGTLAAKTVIKGFSSFFGVDLGASEETLQKLFQSIDLAGRLIILEDIERTQINLLELMGYVNSLVEQDGVKVLLVANEKEILRYEPEMDSPDDDDSLSIFEEKTKNKDKVYTAETLEYLKIKEKTISDTIVFSGNFEEAIKQIIRSFADAKLNHFADDDHAKEIYDIMGECKSYNLRSFIYACQKTADIYQSLAGDYNDDFLTCIFYGIIHYSMRVKTGDSIVWSGTEVYSLELGSEKYPLFRFCYDYMQYHVIKREKIPAAEKILKNLRLYDMKKTQNDQDLIIISNYHRFPEKKLRAAVEAVQNRLNDPTDISFYDYGALAVNLLHIKHYYGIDVSTGKALLVENLRGRGNEIDSNVLFRIAMHRGEPPLQNEYNTLREAMVDALEGDKFLAGFKYNPEETATFCQMFDGYREHYENGKLTAMLDIPRMIEMFQKCTPEQMDTIRYTFVKAYRSVNIGQFLSADKDALVELRDGIMNGMHRDELDCVQKLQCDWFADNLQDIIEKLH